MVENNNRKSKKRLNKSRIIILSAILILLIIIGVFLISRSNKEISNEKALKMLEEVMVLPNEEPTITTIKDAKGLKQDDQFYLNAEDGDKIFIYVKSRKIIVYRPKENKIINAGPILNDLPE